MMPILIYLCLPCSYLGFTFVFLVARDCVDDLCASTPLALSNESESYVFCKNWVDGGICPW
jgi:hypothetical protein